MTDINPPCFIYRDSYRTQTEDHIAVFETTDGFVLAVADGVGGRANGGAAAEYAVRQVGEQVRASRDGQNTPDWSRFAGQLDREVFHDDACGETTLVIVEVSPLTVRGVSVGDSEVWIVAPGGHFDLTERQMAKPFLGSGAAIVTPFRFKTPATGMLIAATDGLFKYATPARIEATLTGLTGLDLRAIAQTLGGLPRLRSGTLPDDIAFCVCRLDGFAPQTRSRRLRLLRLREASWVPLRPDEDR